MFKKVLGILPKIFNGVFKVVVMAGALLSMATAYIVFAPDNLPKPFYLQYGNGSGDTGGAAIVPAAAVDPATPTPAPHEYKPGEGIMVDMSTKIINLVDPTGRRYIRVTIVLEFAPDDPTYDTMADEAKTTYVKAFQDKVTARMPVMDDTVITLLSTKTYDDLYTAEGKEKTRTELMELLSQKLPDLHLLAIYFTEFVVQ